MTEELKIFIKADLVELYTLGSSLIKESGLLFQILDQSTEYHKTQHYTNRITDIERKLCLIEERHKDFRTKIDKAGSKKVKSFLKPFKYSFNGTIGVEPFSFFILWVHVFLHRVKTKDIQKLKDDKGKTLDSFALESKLRAFGKKAIDTFDSEGFIHEEEKEGDTTK